MKVSRAVCQAREAFYFQWEMKKSTHIICMHARINHVTMHVFRYIDYLKCYIMLIPNPPEALSPCSHVSQCSCQALIAWAVAVAVGRRICSVVTADAAGNVGVVASCSPGVMQTLWWYAKECLPSRSILFSQNSLWLYLLQEPYMISLFLISFPRD